MRSFKNIATLIKTKRIMHPNRYSQSEISRVLGYKNGQFISNVERGLCGVPLEVMSKIANMLDINQEEMSAAMIKDHEATIAAFFKKGQEGTEEKSPVKLMLVA